MYRNNADSTCIIQFWNAFSLRKSGKDCFVAGLGAPACGLRRVLCRGIDIITDQANREGMLSGVTGLMLLTMNQIARTRMVNLLVSVELSLLRPWTRIMFPRMSAEKNRRTWRQQRS